MPTIIHARIDEHPIGPEDSIILEIELRTASVGPITFQLSFNAGEPYAFIVDGKSATSVQIVRIFDTAGEHTLKLTFRLIQLESRVSHPPRVEVIAAGLDGSSAPYVVEITGR